MAKRELIDRNDLDITTIETDDFSGNEVLDVVLMEDVEEAPVITEQEIVKPILDKMRAEIKAMSGDIETIADVLQIIDKYKAESEG